MNASQWLAPGLLAVAGLAWVLDRAGLARGRAAAPTGAAAGAARAWTLRLSGSIAFLAALFPVVLAVAVVSSCVGRLHGVQSQSMVPTLRDGDIVLAVRYELGWRLPGGLGRIPAWRPLRRGDLVVFEYPLDPSRTYVKRVLGVPGDRIEYDVVRGFTINGEPVPSVRIEDFHFSDTGIDYPRYEERLGDTAYRVITYNAGFRPRDIGPEPGHPHLRHCRYETTRVRCTVPAGHLFTVGDNRDRSVDSRYWGFVGEADVLGRVVARAGNWKALLPGTPR